jgi:hypothetical protein
MSDKFKKTTIESHFRTHQFRRPDGNGWLGETETIAASPAPSIIVIQKNTPSPVISDMISDISIYTDNTSVKFKISNGVAGNTYQLFIKITSSLGQVFEDVVECEVTTTAPT